MTAGPLGGRRGRRSAPPPRPRRPCRPYRPSAPRPALRLRPSPPARPPPLPRHRFAPGSATARILAALVALLLLVPHSSVLEHRAVVAVFLLALLTGRGRLFLRDWLPLVGVAALFVVLRQLAAASPFPHQGASVAALESRLFRGVSPPTWLQERLYQPGSPGPLEYLATAVHASYFFGFVAVGLGIWLVRRERFAHYPPWLLALTFAFGLLGYVLFPTEPPWLGAREGFAPPAARVIAETAQGTQLSAGIVAAGRTWQQDPDALGDPNPAARCPACTPP